MYGTVLAMINLLADVAVILRWMGSVFILFEKPAVPGRLKANPPHTLEHSKKQALDPNPKPQKLKKIPPNKNIILYYNLYFSTFTLLYNGVIVQCIVY